MLVFSATGRGFSFLQNVETGSVACPVSNGSWGVKQAGPEADSSPPSSDGLNSAWNYTSTLPHAFIVWAGTALLNLMNPCYAAYVCVCVCNSEAGIYVKYEVTMYC